ncbi:hypothetical protein EYF80_036354 [Liparis tanakae]|uniref:Uncharacterized protein n=1 Tax=Liparis tanakae TaxID=230148 RepID=A0A4Z2GKY1_9TELE|nr:hypothetical protein EYF80_036354 [Liparis tanakae]
MWDTVIGSETNIEMTSGIGLQPRDFRSRHPDDVEVVEASATFAYFLTVGASFLGDGPSGIWSPTAMDTFKMKHSFGSYSEPASWSSLQYSPRLSLKLSSSRRDRYVGDMRRLSRPYCRNLLDDPGFGKPRNRTPLPRER